ncbi:MAG TPA: hypothetical protein PKW90_22575, partial [Myxococcota bacterium]|nr:hypothetical protein [Myxococcota bacterium]
IDLLHGTERLRAVWLQALTDAELAYAEVMAERLPRGTGAEQARLISAVTVAAVRLAIQRGAAEHRPSGALFAEFAALLGDSLFEARR